MASTWCSRSTRRREASLSSGLDLAGLSAGHDQRDDPTDNRPTQEQVDKQDRPGIRHRPRYRDSPRQHVKTGKQGNHPSKHNHVFAAFAQELMRRPYATWMPQIFTASEFGWIMRA